MSHKSQLDFFLMAINYYPKMFEGAVLDIGSLDINGGPHILLNSQKYVGVDLGHGPNVDIICRGEDLELASGGFDVAMSSECFEHNPNWQPTLHNMIRMTKNGGLVIFTSASIGRAEHGTTRSDMGYAAPCAIELGQEWYQNLSRKQVSNALLGSSLILWFVVVNNQFSDLMFAGLKVGASKEALKKFSEFELESKKLFGNSRFSGRLVRRFIVRIFGDYGDTKYRKLTKALRLILKRRSIK